MAFLKVQVQADSRVVHPTEKILHFPLLPGGGTAPEERDGGWPKDSACGQQLYSAHLALVCTLAYLQDKETGRIGYTNAQQIGFELYGLWGKDIRYCWNMVICIPHTYTSHSHKLYDHRIHDIWQSSLVNPLHPACYTVCAEKFQH